MPQPPNPTVAKLEAIEDPVERAAAAQTFLTNGRDTIRLVEALRDQAIREVQRKGGITIDQLADRMKCGRHIVVDARRGQKKENPR
jgi:hypothetical protein